MTHDNNEAKTSARRAAVSRYKANVRNVSIDADLVEQLNATADALETQFGFRPTLSQTMRHLIVTSKKDAPR